MPRNRRKNICRDGIPLFRIISGIMDEASEAAVSDNALRAIRHNGRSVRGGIQCLAIEERTYVGMASRYGVQSTEYRVQSTE